MEEIAFVSVLYIWLVLLGVLVFRAMRGLKGFSNVLLLFVKYSLLGGIFVIPLSFLLSSFAGYFLALWFSYTMLLLNVLQRKTIGVFDVLSLVVFLFLGVIESVSGINVFFPIVLVYLVLYTIYYVSPRLNVPDEVKKVVVTTSIVVSIGVGSVSVLAMVNVTHYHQVVMALTIVVSLITSYFVLILSYAKSADVASNAISTLLLEKENKLGDILARIVSVTRKLKDSLSLLEVDVGKVERNKILEFIRDLSSSVTEINPIVEFIQKTARAYQARVEEIGKALPVLSDRLFKEFSELLAMKQILLETNTAVMSLVKVALDSEKSVMGVSRSIKDLRNAARSLTDNMKAYSEISEQSSILSINIGVEASKLGSRGAVFLKLSHQAKKFSDTIYSNIETTKRLIKELDSKAEFSEYMVKTLVMSFVEIETNLKSISKSVSTILEKFEVFSGLVESIRRDIEEMSKMSLVIPEFSMEISRRGDDILLNYKKIRKYSEDVLSTASSLEHSLRNIVENVESTVSFIKEFLGVSTTTK